MRDVYFSTSKHHHSSKAVQSRYQASFTGGSNEERNTHCKHPTLNCISYEIVVVLSKQTCRHSRLSWYK